MSEEETPQDPYIQALSKKLDAHLEDVIYAKTYPRYEGPIDVEKLKNFDISIVHQPSTKRYWVEQNGTRIGDYFYYGSLVSM